MNTIDASFEEAEAEALAAHASLRKASRQVLHLREELNGSAGRFNPVGRQPETVMSKRKLQELLDDAESKELDAEENWMLATQHLEEVEAAMEDEQH